MVKLIPMDPAEIDTSRSGRRGRVSYPIIKSFMEQNVKVVKLDLTGLNKNPQYLRTVLTSYIKNHNMPIKIFSAAGDLCLMRLDLNNDGSPKEDWQSNNELTTEGAAGHERNMEPVAIDATEVAKRFNQEKGDTTK